MCEIEHLCVCACLCEREREREKERAYVCERALCVCVCVCVCVCDESSKLEKLRCAASQSIFIVKLFCNYATIEIHFMILLTVT